MVSQEWMLLQCPVCPVPSRWLDEDGALLLPEEKASRLRGWLPERQSRRGWGTRWGTGDGGNTLKAYVSRVLSLQRGEILALDGLRELGKQTP